MTMVGYGEYGNVGLEDVTAADLVLPRLNIDNKKNMFVNSVTKAEYDEVEVILLAQVKQRVMWPPDVDESPNPMPQCKSTDFVHGFPNVDPKAPFDKLFPWAESSFQPEAGAAGQYEVELSAEVGLPALPCEKCAFQKWVNKKTRCQEQHTFPLLMNEGSAEDQHWAPAILTLKGSGIQPSKTYVSGFATSQTLLFSTTTMIKLDQRSRGTVNYSVPIIRKGNPTDPTMFGEYAASARGMRENLRRPPTKRDDSAAAAPQPIQNQNAAPVQVAPPAPAPAPAQVIDAQPAPVVQQPVAQPQQPAPLAQPVQPVQQVAPPQPAPVQQVAPPVQAAPPAPAVDQAPPVTAAVEGEDDLPF